MYQMQPLLCLGSNIICHQIFCLDVSLILSHGFRTKLFRKEKRKRNNSVLRVYLILCFSFFHLRWNFLVNYVSISAISITQNTIVYIAHSHLTGALITFQNLQHIYEHAIPNTKKKISLQSLCFIWLRYLTVWPLKINYPLASTAQQRCTPPTLLAILSVSCAVSSSSAHFLDTGTAQCSVMSLLCVPLVSNTHIPAPVPNCLGSSSQLRATIMKIYLHLWKPASECLPYIHAAH